MKSFCAGNKTKISCDIPDENIIEFPFILSFYLQLFTKFHSNYFYFASKYFFEHRNWTFPFIVANEFRKERKKCLLSNIKVKCHLSVSWIFAVRGQIFRSKANHKNKTLHILCHDYYQLVGCALISSQTERVCLREPLSDTTSARAIVSIFEIVQ